MANETPMADAPDPRVYFAAERTMLAWVRTGLAVIGLGFVVARFGLFLRMIRSGPDVAPHTGSTLIGVGLVLLGSSAIGLAAWQHAKFYAQLNLDDKPRGYPVRWSVAFSAIISIVGIILAGYLLLGVNGS